MKSQRKNLIILLLGIVCLSCVSTKKITYFQALTPETDEAISRMQEQYIPRIKPDDILSITVSSLNKEANEMFNPESYRGVYQAQQQNNTTIAPNPIIGFTVDATGAINLPLIGKVQVAGMSSKEVSALLTGQLQQYLESPSVSVRIANYQVTLMGEVARPAVYTIPNELITIPQLIAMGGDMSIYGKRKNVLIIREVDGQRQFARVDMTQRDIFDSPYYYLHSGDVVYVESTAGKITSTDRIYQLTPIVISSLTLLVLIFNTFK